MVLIREFGFLIGRCKVKPLEPECLIACLLFHHGSTVVEPARFALARLTALSRMDSEPAVGIFSIILSVNKIDEVDRQSYTLLLSH